MKKPLAVIRYLLSIHITVLFILAFFRLILYFINVPQAGDITNKSVLLFSAMLKGLQFDNLMSCYIIAIPTVILLIFALFNKIPNILVTIFNIFFIVAYTIILAVSAADIPYFSYFFTHLGGSILNWLAFEGTAGMILQESSYYIYFLLFIITSTLFGIAVFGFGRKLKRTNTTDLKGKSYAYYIPLTIIIFGLCFMGLRGSFGRYPLRVSGAYFCSSSFFNQLGVNPAFFLLKSTSSYLKQKDKLKGIMGTEEAIDYVKKSLKIEVPTDEQHPISRYVEETGEVKNTNIVIILMESMSSEFLNMEYKGKTLTPYLHSLINKSYYFENFYSAGIHTNNGIAASLYGFPPIFERTMMTPDPDYYTGLPINLKQQGYQTLFFVTSDPQYDNMYSFLNENGFDHIYSQYDYPSGKVVNNFGVQDDYLFEYGINKLNEAAEKNKPFLATFMTVSNHPPFVVPQRFDNSGNNDQEKIIAFADTSLKEFMEEAEKQKWYKNTIFILLGDHGHVLGKQIYEMPLTYNHIPFIIYSPLFEDAPKLFTQPAGQIDIFPTVMGMLNQSYINNSLGIDLFREHRPYTVFVSDNHLGCIDEKYLYIYDPTEKTDRLYEYKTKNPDNLRDIYTAKADSMKHYSVSTITTADYLVKSKKTGPTELTR